MVTYGGFSCIGANQIVEVMSDSDGLYFNRDDGRDYLKSQLDNDGLCIGLTALSDQCS